jgi:hypothetical protein
MSNGSNERTPIRGGGDLARSPVRIGGGEGGGEWTRDLDAERAEHEAAVRHLEFELARARRGFFSRLGHTVENGLEAAIDWVADGVSTRRARASSSVPPGRRQRARTRRRRRHRGAPRARASVRSLQPAPAVLLSRRLDLLVWNPTAEALLGPFGAERNYARLVFGDPATRALHADWDEAARETVALLRFAAARYPDDEALRELIAELRRHSDTAAHWWETHDVTQKRHGHKRYTHPTVGQLTLHYEALHLPDDGDQLLTIYAAEPGTTDAERLAQLSELVRAAA